MSAESATNGPVLWLTACIHGDEVGGIVIIQEVFKRIRHRLRKGMVYAFPLMNPLGFDTTSRNITLSREDLNRSFPGNPNGTLGERLAERIFTTILETSPTLVLDLHNDWIKSIPYALIDRDPGKSYQETYQKARSMLAETGFCAIEETEAISRSFSYNLLLNSIPAITLELGEPYVVNERNIMYGVNSIWNIMAHLGMIEPQEEPFRYPLPEEYGGGKILKYFDKPYSSKSGIIRFMAKPGDVVKKGQPLGRIVNAFGKLQETVIALEDAIVLGHSDSSVVFPGMPVMAFGT